MSELTDYIGNRIRLYRKQKNITIEELAKKINKSKSTVSKYESGNIVIDIETLFELARVLNINIHQLIDFNSEQDTDNCKEQELVGFFANKYLYLYFYDGRKNKITKGYIEIIKNTYNNDRIDSNLYLDIENFNEYMKCDTLYYGQIELHDVVTNATFINQANHIERINLTVLNPMTNSGMVSALLTGISGNPFIPVAIKCVISIAQIKDDTQLLEKLMINKEDIRVIKKYNFFTNQIIL